MEITHKGRFILLTGLSGSGKSTLGNMLVNHLNQFGVRPAFLIDGDISRSFFENDLGYSIEERKTVSRRMAFGAFTLTENNIDVVMANIAPSSDVRDFFRKKFTEYIEVFLDADIELLKNDDAKGVYKTNLAKSVPNLVGHDIEYEQLIEPDLRIQTYLETPEESLNKIIIYLRNRGPVIGTKADTLYSLSRHLDYSIILPQKVLTWDMVNSNQKEMFKGVKEKLGDGPYIVRSSCRDEDNKESSNAGAFSSILNVESEQNKFINAVRQVYQSYSIKEIESPEYEQILIQPMLASVKSSGVVFTRYKYSDSPYYVINYDLSGDTSSVTSGLGGKLVFLNRRKQLKKEDPWHLLILAVKELEEKFPNTALDIEFAITESNDVVIFQCRSLKVEVFHISLEKNAYKLIDDLKSRIERYQDNLPHIPGDTTILSDMADWNPSEIIGDRPSTLSYSVYRELITANTWHEARSSQGYFDLLSAELMSSLAKKPYIDIRYSFASLTPANISNEIRDKLMTYYINKLASNPHFHDKVEFEVLYTCYDLTVESKLKQANILNNKQELEFVNALRDLTNNILLNHKANLNKDYDFIDKLDAQYHNVIMQYKDKEEYWEKFQAAYLLLKMTQRLGAYPFARIARTAFIAHSILNSLVDTGLLKENQRQNFLSSISTTATSFYETLKSTSGGEGVYDELINKFGHLRMNTYDITSPRYDQMPDDFWSSDISNNSNNSSTFEVPESDKARITKALEKNGIDVDATSLFEFIKSTIQAREDSKLRFTRALSMGLEFIASGSEQLGISRDEIQNVTLSTLYRFRNPEFSSSVKAAEYLRQRIGEKINERTVFDLIKMPSFIRTPSDIDYIEIGEAKPNFISDKKVLGETVLLCSDDELDNIEINSKIVLIENADPGYDWIFAHNIKGLITKYGGVASHMAIRCSEFNIPGAIGCGEIIFDKLEKSNSILLDCKSGIVSQA